jgi:hypothetical protein
MLRGRPGHRYHHWPERNDFVSLNLLGRTSPWKVDEMESMELPTGLDDANEGACGGRRCAFPPYTTFKVALKNVGVGR